LGLATQRPPSQRSRAQPPARQRWATDATPLGLREALRPQRCG